MPLKAMPSTTTEDIFKRLILISGKPNLTFEKLSDLTIHGVQAMVGFEKVNCICKEKK